MTEVNIKNLIDSEVQKREKRLKAIKSELRAHAYNKNKITAKHQNGILTLKNQKVLGSEIFTTCNLDITEASELLYFIEYSKQD